MKTEAELLIEQAFANKLDLNAPDVDASKATTQDDEDPKTGSGSTKETTETTIPATDPAGKDAAAALEEQPAPIASKSGAYTIPYEKLTEARTKASTLEAQNATLNQRIAELETLQQQAQARQDAGQAPTKQDETLATVLAAIEAGVPPEKFGDFSEKAMAKGVIDIAAEVASKIVDAKVAEALKPFQQKAAQTEEQAYYGAILAKHPDAIELMESAEFKTWVTSQPAFAQAGINHALDKGTNGEVIGVFDAFKAATKPAAAAPGKPDAKALAEAAVANAAAPVPTSLSELPGAAGMTDSEHALAIANDPQKLMEMMMSMTPEKRARTMDRAV